MGVSKGGRRQPRKPDLSFGKRKPSRNQIQVDPASPPDTPTASPHQARQNRSAFPQAPRSVRPDARIQPVGNGHNFSYQPYVGPDQLSPRSASSSEAVDDSDKEDCSSEEDCSPDHFTAPPPPSPPSARNAQSSSDENDSEEGAESDEDEKGDDDDDYESDLPTRRSTEAKPASQSRPIVQVQDEAEDNEDDSESENDAVRKTMIPQPTKEMQYKKIEDEDDDDDDDESSSGYAEVVSEDGVVRPTLESPVYATATITTTVCDFILEDMDPMDSDNGLEVLQPDEVESNRSRSRSSSQHRPPPKEHRELPIRMMQDLKNLNCSNETSDDDEVEQDAEETFYKWQQYMRRRRVSQSSSIGKRTFSERSDSDDSDDGGLDVNEVGSSARRMKKRMHRGSLLFQDPPEPRIDELEEPNSSEDEYLTSQHLGMELPYWTIEINEMDDSS
ncbi:hypothetical protein NQ176_g7460 [Zarea fungicola]|uniref:Uncharacterized protein n=1 Tax=Zarea fungicola TaxID=93591 RepID=A0ACC1MYJ3_9HYPO|nr:hypothetical protein NQ176_g7460 [Lecanicillium fungicola]